MKRTIMTMQEADKAGLMQLTEFNNPTALIKTQYGRIGYREWVEKEYDRIMANPSRSGAVVTITGGKVALYVNKVAGGKL